LQERASAICETVSRGASALNVGQGTGCALFVEIATHALDVSTVVLSFFIGTDRYLVLARQADCTLSKTRTADALSGFVASGESHAVGALSACGPYCRNDKGTTQALLFRFQRDDRVFEPRFGLAWMGNVAVCYYFPRRVVIANGAVSSRGAEVQILLVVAWTSQKWIGTWQLGAQWLNGPQERLQSGLIDPNLGVQWM
jgi:hypothetical protein